MKSFTTFLFLFGLLALVFGNPLADPEADAEPDAEADAFPDAEEYTLTRRTPQRGGAGNAAFKFLPDPATPKCTPCKVVKNNLKAYSNKNKFGPVIEKHMKNDWVALQCYTTGKIQNGNKYWDKTVDGRWVSEWWLDTPCVYTLPKC